MKPGDLVRHRFDGRWDDICCDFGAVGDTGRLLSLEMQEYFRRVKKTRPRHIAFEILARSDDAAVSG